jgi:hypothetical protein
MTERATERSCARRRLRRARQQQAREQVERRAREQGPLAPRTDETVIAFPAPALAPELVPVSTPKLGSAQVEPFASAAIPFPRVATGGARTP